jgi:hypothetical protein
MTAAWAAACPRLAGSSTGAHCHRQHLFCVTRYGQPPAAWLTRRNATALRRRSGKFQVLARLLDYLRQHTSDRIVLVSNYTQTLDLFQNFCRERCVGHAQVAGAGACRASLGADAATSTTLRTAGATRHCV